jgi:D-alanine-D-alanine ligase
MNIAVLFGGISTERNVSLVGGNAVCKALRSKGHNVIPIDPAFGLDKDRQAEKLIAEDVNLSIDNFTTLEELSKFSSRSYIECVNSELFDNVDCAFIVLHGKYGEDGTIQSLLDLRRIKYTGSGARASAIAMDKTISKTIFSANGILTPRWEVLNPNDIDDDENFLEYIKKSFGKKIVIKPADQGSTVGLTIVTDGYIDSIIDGVREASKYSDNILMEQYIKGRELTVAILDEEPLPVIEIVTEDGFYDYEHKYTKGKTSYYCPANIPSDIAEFTQNVALAAYKSIGCKCFARVDFILDEEGQPFCLEVNTIPGFSSSSLVPKAAKQIGLEFPELCEKLIEIACIAN